MIEDLKKQLNQRQLPYNANGHIWGQCASCYFKSKEYEKYLHAATMSLLYYSTHHSAMLGNYMLDAMYKSDSLVDFFGVPFFRRVVKALNNTHLKVNIDTPLIAYVNSIKPLLYSVGGLYPPAKPYNSKDVIVVKKIQSAYSQLSDDVFNNLYNNTVKPLLYQ